MPAAKPFIARLVLSLAAFASLGGAVASPADAAVTEAQVKFSPGDPGESTDVPLIGDWDGDGVQTVGAYRPRTREFALKNTNDLGITADVHVGGDPGDTPLVGRWNPSLTRDVIGLYRRSNGIFYFSVDATDHTDGSLQVTAAGTADTPLAGDWNGDGIDTFGLWHPSTRNAEGWVSNTGAATIPIAIGAGNPNDIPIIGDWNADGTDTLGVFRQSDSKAPTFYGTDPAGPNANPQGVDVGNPGWLPVVGDFDGDGSDGLGVYDQAASRFYLTDSNKAPAKTPPPGGGTPTPAPGGGTPTPAPGGNGTPGAPAGNGTIGGVTVNPGTSDGRGGTTGTAGKVTTSKRGKIVTTTFGKKTTLSGRLDTPDGRPIAGATLDVYDEIALAGAAKTKVGTVVTGADGTFSYAPVTTASRTVEFAYAPRAGTDLYSDVLSVQLRVKAGITFKLSRSTARRAQAVRFSGTVRTDPLPKRGVRVVIEAQSGKRWVTSALLRLRADATFTWSHRFKTRGPFRFRARVLSSDTLPARPNATGVKTIRIR